MENHRRSSTWNIIYETIVTPVLWKEALKELFGFGSTKFEVTPKLTPNSNTSSKTKVKMSKTNKKLLAGHLILLVLNVIGLIMCVLGVQQRGLTVYALSLIWLMSNTFYLAISVAFDLQYKPVNYKNFVPNGVTKY